jgi:multicomponent Na+:H+ antiporter subunit B
VSGRVLRPIFLVALAVFTVGGLLAVIELPPYAQQVGFYGELLRLIALDETGAVNTVSSVLFDQRSPDTLGEELALFAAATGITLLLRERNEEEELEAPRAAREERTVTPSSETVRIAALALVAPTVLFGIYVVGRGHISFGGGFQGGVLVASGLLLIYLSGRYETLRSLAPDDRLEAIEGFGAGGYVLVGLTTLLLGAAFLQNVLPMGTPGELLSAGTVPLLSFLVGMEVVGAVTLIAVEFQEQQLLLRPAED